MHTIKLSPGSIGFPKGSERSGQQAEARIDTAQVGFGEIHRITVKSVLLLVWNTLIRWQRRATMRHALREMDDRMLRDIGLTRRQVDREANKSFWRV